MDLNAFLLDGVVASTAPPNETVADADRRRDAIHEMFHAFTPSDAVQAMIACQCVSLQFLLNAAMRDATSFHVNPAVATRTRAGAVAISRALHQWVTKLEKLKQRDEAREAELRQAEQDAAQDNATEAKPTPARGHSEAPPRPVTMPPGDRRPARPECEVVDDVTGAVQSPDGRPRAWTDGTAARIAS
jgi:hypothetical protein